MGKKKAPPEGGTFPRAEMRPVAYENYEATAVLRSGANRLHPQGWMSLGSRGTGPLPRHMPATSVPFGCPNRPFAKWQSLGCPQTHFMSPI